MCLVNVIYNLVDKFSSTEKFVLSSQIIRSVVSIPSNIAEGVSRSLEKCFAKFLEIALGFAFNDEAKTKLLSKFMLKLNSKS